MVYFTLDLILTSTAKTLGAAALYRGIKPQDSSSDEQAAAPASAQQCLQSLAYAVTSNPRSGHRQRDGMGQVQKKQRIRK